MMPGLGRQRGIRLLLGLWCFCRSVGLLFTRSNMDFFHHVCNQVTEIFRRCSHSVHCFLDQATAIQLRVARLEVSQTWVPKQLRA